MNDEKEEEETGRRGLPPDLLAIARMERHMDDLDAPTKKLVVTYLALKHLGELPPLE